MLIKNFGGTVLESFKYAMVCCDCFCERLVFKSLIIHLRHGRGSLEQGAYSHVYLLSDGPRRTVKYMEVCVGRRGRCCLAYGGCQRFLTVIYTARH